MPTSMTLRKDLGKLIKAAREAKMVDGKPMTQRQASIIVGVHEASYARFERSPHKAQARTLIPSLALLGLTDLTGLIVTKE